MALNFFKFDASAWLTGKIQLLSAEEKGVFIELVARIWFNGGEIKNDGILHRLLRVEKATLSNALQAFFDLEIMYEENGILRLKFVDEQISDINSFKEQQSEYGKRGGRPPKDNQRVEKATLSSEKGDQRVEKPIKNKTENKKEKEDTIVSSKEKPTLSQNYPESVEEVLEIASQPQCAARISREEAERYFVTRMASGWVDAAGRKIAPEGIIWDLKKWEMGTNERRGSPKNSSTVDYSDPSTWGDL